MQNTMEQAENITFSVELTEKVKCFEVLKKGLWKCSTINNVMAVNYCKHGREVEKEDDEYGLKDGTRS